MTIKTEIKYNGRTLAEWIGCLEDEKADVEKAEQRVLEATKDVTKAAKKKTLDISAIRQANRSLTHELKRLDNQHEWVAKLEGFVKTAERYQAGHAEILEFLEQMFEKDMAWYREIKVKHEGKGIKEMKESGYTMVEYMISQMTEADAIKTFRNDLDTRYYKLVKQIETKVGSIEKFDLERNGNFSFDGIVKGEKGTARINTIVAGGYNIQRAHYRTLVKSV